MKIVLVEKTSEKVVNKDQMGGYGINTQVGDSFFAKWIMRQKKVMRYVPILSLGYLAGIFSRDGHEIKVMDDGSRNVIGGDLYIIASSIVDYKSELQTAYRIRKKFPEAKIGFIGPFAVFLSEEYLRFGDFIIHGEPEHVGMEISKGDIPEGIVESPMFQNLDELPFPKWEFFNIENYCYYPTVRRRPFLSIQSSRGCALSCDYCPYLRFQRNWRTRSVENILEEIRHLIDKFQIRGLLFRDPIFTQNKNRSRQIAEGIIRNGFDLEWACETRTDALDEELVDLMYRAGLRAINLGIESSRQDLLDKAGRKMVDVEHQERIIKYCERKGIRIIAFYLLGLQDDTVDTVKGTIAYARKLNTFLSQFHIFTPFPGTEFYDKVKDRVFETDWEKFNSFTPVICNDNISCEVLSSLKERAFVTYYFRLAYLIKHFKHLVPLWRKMLPF